MQKISDQKNTDSAFNAVRYKNDFIRQNYDRITLAVKKGKKEKWNLEAKEQSLSLSEYITRRVDGDLT